jgi:hypothetical protein
VTVGGQPVGQRRRRTTKEVLDRALDLGLEVGWPRKISTMASAYAPSCFCASESGTPSRDSGRCAEGYVQIL